jgi:hypothetical protein
MKRSENISWDLARKGKKEKNKRTNAEIWSPFDLFINLSFCITSTCTCILSAAQTPYPEAVDMNGRFQMQGGKNRILPKYINANRFFWDSHWLEIWSNHFCPSMGLNGVSVATDSG